jgi:hypothetical protein
LEALIIRLVESMEDILSSTRLQFC